MMIRALLSLIVLMAVSNNLIAASANGNVTLLRSHTVENDIAEIRQYTVFQVDAVLAAPCTWFYIAPEDKGALSILIAARAVANRAVTVHYYTERVSSWHAGTCAVHAIDY